MDYQLGDLPLLLHLYFGVCFSAEIAGVFPKHFWHSVLTSHLLDTCPVVSLLHTKAEYNCLESMFQFHVSSSQVECKAAASHFPSV